MRRISGTMGLLLFCLTANATAIHMTAHGVVHSILGEEVEDTIAMEVHWLVDLDHAGSKSSENVYGGEMPGWIAVTDVMAAGVSIFDTAAFSLFSEPPSTDETVGFDTLYQAASLQSSDFYRSSSVHADGSSSDLSMLLHTSLFLDGAPFVGAADINELLNWPSGVYPGARMNVSFGQVLDDRECSSSGDCTYTTLRQTGYTMTITDLQVASIPEPRSLRLLLSSAAVLLGFAAIRRQRA